MFRFIMGLATGYLTMTPDGQKLAKIMTDELKKEATGFLKKEGVIEPNKDARPTESPKPDDKPEKLNSTDEPII